MDELQYQQSKMERLVAKDRLLQFVVQDLMSRSHMREKALELAFNGYVLEDSIMEDAYRRA